MADTMITFLTSHRFISPLLIIIGGLILYQVINLVLKKAIRKGQSELDKKRFNTIILLFNSIIKYILIVVAVIMILNVYEVDTSTFIAGLGIAGIVIGFALQDAIKDILGGINIVLDNYFILGDMVKYNDFTGTVIEFGLKSTKIKRDNGEVLVIANRLIDRIINLSQKQAVITIEVPTAPECESLKVSKTLISIIEKVKKYSYVDAEGSYYAGIDRLDSKMVVYTFNIKCQQGKQTELKREVLGMIKEAYEKAALKLV